MPQIDAFPEIVIKKGLVIAERFQVMGKLGEGGCGSVWKARDLKRNGLEVALKILENTGDEKRFNREIQVLRKVRHENVVRLAGAGMIAGRAPKPYLAMELVEDGSLRELLDARRKIRPQEAGWLLMQTVRGLQAVDTVHRDLKPENLLLRGVGSKKYKDGHKPVVILSAPEQSGTVVKVADFGLAKPMEQKNNLSLTRSGQIMGTPVYMSPEQCRNSKDVSFKTDIYAIGILLFEMVTGNPPFDADNVYDIMNMQCDKEPIYVKSMPDEVRIICERCLAKKPGQRYRNLNTLGKDLAALTGINDSGSNTDRSWFLWISVVLTVLVTAVCVWLFQESILKWIDILFS